MIARDHGDGSGSRSTTRASTPWRASDTASIVPAAPAPTTTTSVSDRDQYRYSAKRWDAATGTYDMGARRYNPSTTRWMQQDVYFGALANLGLSSDPLTANFRSAEATRLRKALAAMLGVEP